MKQRKERRQKEKGTSQRKSKLDNMTTLTRIEERLEEEDDEGKFCIRYFKPLFLKMLIFIFHEKEESQ